MKQIVPVREFWVVFCRKNPQIDPEIEYQVWNFGNTNEMALDLGNLVRSGKKIATSSLKSVNELQPENAPVPEGYSVVTDFEGNPICIIQTVEIQELAFDEVDSQFAFDEGEGDQTLEYWRDIHRRYFALESAWLGLEFDERSIICCERFKLLFPNEL